MKDVNDMSPEEFDFYIQSRGFATAYRVDPPPTMSQTTPEQKAEEEKSPWFTPEEIAALPSVRPMTAEEEAEYAAMEESMALHEGGGPDPWGITDSAEEKPWFEKDQDDHDHDHVR
jgi:hypothetical protein